MASLRQASVRLSILDDDDEHRALLREYLERDGRFAVVGTHRLVDGMPLGPADLDLVVVDPVREGRFDMQYVRLLLAEASRTRVAVRTVRLPAAAAATNPCRPRHWTPRAPVK